MTKEEKRVIAIKKYYDKHKVDPEWVKKQKAAQRRYRDSGRAALVDKRNWLKNRYGITIEEYNNKLEFQKGACACCGGKDVKALAVDHDHATGKVRGLLCYRCNLTLGQVKDNVNLLLSMFAYLKSWGEKCESI
jgi:hypothetical protein